MLLRDHRNEKEDSPSTTEHDASRLFVSRIQPSRKNGNSISIYSPCKLPHPALAKVDFKSLPCPLSHPWTRVEGQNLKPGEPI